MDKSKLATDLIELAAERSSEKRVELLRRITDTYIEETDRCSPAEQYLFNEVVTKLLDKIASPDRAAASAKLAKLPTLTDDLALKLALDNDIEVARPIIRDHAQLSEQVLIDVANAGSQEHLAVIAGRSVVTPPVSSIVVTRGDQTVVHTLAANQGAQFSAEGMDKLISRAQTDAALQTLIVGRSDLSLTAISKLLPMISEELSSRLRGVFVDVDKSMMREHVFEWMESRKKESRRVKACIDGLRKGDLRPDDVLRELVRGGQLFDAATVLASILTLDDYYTFNLLAGRKLESALLLMRAADLSWPIAESLLKLRVSKYGLPASERVPERGDYLAMDSTAAQRVVRFFKARRAATTQ